MAGKKLKPSVDRIVNNKVWKEIVGESFVVDSIIRSELESVLDLIFNPSDYRPRMKIVSSFAKFNLSDYRKRLESIIKNPNNISLEFYIIRYGEEEGTRLYDEYCDKLSNIRSLPHFIKKYGKEKGTDIFNKIQDKKLNTLDGFIKRDGVELGTRKYNDFCERNKGNWSEERQVALYGEIEGQKSFKKIKETMAYVSSLQGYIDRHGRDEGSRLWNKKMQNMHFASSREGYISKYGKQEGLKIMREMKNNNSLESFIRRYGADDGLIKYTEFLEKSTQFPFYSKLSEMLFNSIVKDLPIELQSECLYARNEKRWYDRNNKKEYLYDFIIPSIKYCIEFNGDLWHANPSIYKSTDYPNPFYPELDAQSIWVADQEKQQFIKDQGYQLKIIWEKDFHNNKKEIIKECVSEIKTLCEGT